MRAMQWRAVAGRALRLRRWRFEVLPTPIYFVNQDARPERRQFMAEQFERLGLAATRIAGAEPAELTGDQLACYCNQRNVHFLSPQQLCCSLGHFRAWQAFLATGADRALILEDDAVLSERLPGFLAELPGMPCDVLRVEISSRPHLTSEPVGESICGIGFRQFRSTGWGSAAYIISRQAAEGLLANPHLFDLPTDAMLFCPLELPAKELRLLQADPALCVQLRERPGQVEAGVSSITMRLKPKSFTSWWRLQLRGVRWGWIKLMDALTRRDFRRRVIGFADDQAAAG